MTGNTGGVVSQAGLPNTAPSGSVVSNGQGTFVNNAADGQPPLWTSVPSGYQSTSNVTVPPTPGVTSTLGASSIPTPPAAIDPTASENSQIAEATSSNSGTVAALQAEQQAQDEALKQSQAGETAGYAQTAATLQGIGGISGQWTDFFGKLNEAHQTTMDNLNSQFESAIATANTGLAGQIIQIQQQTQAAQIQQQQQFFENAMSVFNAQVGLVQNQTQNSLAAQTLALQQKQESFTETQATITNATNSLNSQLTQLAGNTSNTWGNLDSATQAQLTTLAQQAGMSPGALQQIVNTNAKTALNTSSYTDPITGATSLVSTNKSGQVVSQFQVDAGWGANSSQGIANVETTYGNTTSDGAKWFQGTVPKQYLSVLINQGYKQLSPALGTQMVGIQDSSNQIQTALQTLAGSQLVAKTSGAMVSDYLNDTVENALQTYDPGNGQTFGSIQDLVNTTIVGAIRNVVGVSGGMGLNAIFNNIGGFTMDSHTTVAQLNAELGNFQQDMQDAQDAIMGVTPANTMQGNNLTASDQSALDAFTNTLSNGQ